MKIWNTLSSGGGESSGEEVRNSTKENRFFSLKWRALILLSLIFVLINAFFYQYNKNNLLAGFDSSRNLKFSQNKAQFVSLLTQSKEHLLQFAELLPSLDNVQQVLQSRNINHFNEQFDNIWSKLEIQSQIESMAFISRDQAIKLSRGLQNFTDLLNISVFNAELLKSQNLERPVFKIFCFNTCNQYGFIPVAVKGENWGTIIIASSLNELAMNFSKSSNINIAFLYPSDDTISHRISGMAEISSWQKDIMLVSNYDKMAPLFSEISKSVSFQSTVNSRKAVEIGKRNYELRSYNLQGAENLFVTYVEDITAPISNINLVTKELFLTGIFALLFSECALLIVLWRPLSKLRHASDIIPLLASNDFSITRNAIAHQKSNSRLKDEIDILDENIIEVSHRLEKLQENVNQRTKTIAEKMSELTRERDFIQNLLDTAQVIIIVQNAKGEIKQINKYLIELSNYSESELKSMRFFDLVLLGDDPDAVKNSLSRIIQGTQENYKNESGFKCKSGDICTIEWLHSRIESKNSGHSEILSVGLDLSERKAYEEEISWLADHDPLTGLLNRRRFHDILKKSINIAKRYDRSIALLFLDLDNFKHVNDTLGHQTGDLLIQAAAANLKLVLRESDYIARFGGDEFAILLPQVNEQAAIEVAEKINKSLTSMRSPLGNTSYRATTSVGLAIYPQHGADDMELLSNADLAMYQAKAKGKGGWHLYSNSDDTRKRFENQMYWRNKINDALAQNTFELHYQPIVSLSDNTVSHYEVLLRMREQDGKLILPTPFITVAEKTGLIQEIDQFVLKRSIDELQMRNATGKNIKLAVNLSAHAFGDDKLFEILKVHLESSNIDPGQLIFEITETAALSDLTGAAELIEKIRSLGCYFALDDFGVGFSTFYYLKELPVDYVKIDGSFIQKLPRNRNDQILVKAITEIAKEFGKKIIAEFVEDSETMDLLKKYNVDYVQGYYVGMPDKEVA